MVIEEMVDRKGEYYTLDLEVWEEVKVQRGESKGEFPVIQKNGAVFVDKNRAGEDVRVFVRKKITETEQ